MADSGVVDVVGIIGASTFGDGATRIDQADLVIGDQRHLTALGDRVRQPTEALRLPLRAGIDRIVECAAAGRRVCVLASGDPGFFGIVRALAERLPAEVLRVHPAPSSVSMAFARLGLPWDDTVVVSAHGRPLAETAHLAARGEKVAVLTGPDSPPKDLGSALLAAGCGPRRVVVLSCLGEVDEQIIETDLASLSARTFDHRSVVVLLGPKPLSSTPLRRWGLPVSAFSHRNSMITKPEVRAVVLSKLELPTTGVLWDIGAGSGSVSVEAALVSPGLRVIAIEQSADDVNRIGTNAAQFGVAVDVRHGSAPDALAGLPQPDRVFVGGGGLGVLDAAWDRLEPGAVLVATFAGLNRATQAADRLGSLIQLTVNQTTTLGSDGERRFVADNPVFICWGTKP